MFSKKIKLIFVVHFLFLLPYLSLAQKQKERFLIRLESNSYQLSQLHSQQLRTAAYNKKLAVIAALQKGFQPLEYLPDGRIREAVSVSPEGFPLYYTTFNHKAVKTTRTHELYTGGSLNLGIHGENMIVAEWDGGLVRPTHELLKGRVEQKDDATKLSNHATHVAGTLIGSDNVKNGRGQGSAYKATLHAYDWNNDVAEAIEAARNGILVSNHSYGYDPEYLPDYYFGKYVRDSRDWDEIMYNAPYYLTVTSAGNARRGGHNTDKNGFDLLSGQAVSKNAMTVAAVHSVAEYTGPSSVKMSGFSSWGPTDDGRIKPDISAQGVSLYSSTSGSDTAYGIYSGTSMASPSVAGSLLLLQQYYHQRHDTYMKASALKGLAIHTADEAGAAPGPDYKFGWGLLNMERAAQCITNTEYSSEIITQTLTNNDTFSLDVEASGKEPLIATLSWTDPAGKIARRDLDLADPSLINDLDIKITKQQETFLPWKLDVSQPDAAATRGDNSVDPVEKVEVQYPSGTYTITISHKGVLQNDVQEYALVVSGIVKSNFALSVPQARIDACNAIAETTLRCELQRTNEPVQIEVEEAPSGLEVTLEKSSVDTSGFIGVRVDVNKSQPGFHTIVLKGTLGNTVERAQFEIYVPESYVKLPILTTPENRMNQVDTQMTLRWETQDSDATYQLQVATNQDFTTIIAEEELEKAELQLDQLDFNTTYYWRVRAIGHCGQSEYTESSEFTTRCQAPQHIRKIVATSSTATLHWEDSPKNGPWTVYFGNPDFRQENGSSITATTTEITIEGLIASTAYEAVVISDCGQTSERISFTTSCEALSGIFYEDFAENRVPDCWTTSGDEDWKFTTDPDYLAKNAGDHSPNRQTGYAWIDGSEPNGDTHTSTLVSPWINVNALASPTIEFSVFSQSPVRKYNQLQVEYTDGEEWYSLLDLQGPTDTAWKTYTYELTNSATTRIQIKFTIIENSPSHAFANDILIDDVKVENRSSPLRCSEPTNLTMGETLADAVQVQWDAANVIEEYEISYGKGTVRPDEGTIVKSDDTAAILSDLEPDTSYIVYVRSVCGAASYSDWSESINIQTTASKCADDLMASVRYFTANKAELEWTGSNAVTELKLINLTTKSDSQQFSVDPKSSTILIDELKPSTEYEVIFKSVCDSGQPVQNSIAFMTSCAVNTSNWLANGDFECGNLGFWKNSNDVYTNEEAKIQARAITHRTKFIEKRSLIQGAYATYIPVGGLLNSPQFIEQEFEVPASYSTNDDVYISYSFISTYSETYEAEFKVILLDAQRNELKMLDHKALQNLSEKEKNQRHSIAITDLIASHKGEKLVLRFEVSTARAKATVGNVIVDRIGIESKETTLSSIDITKTVKLIAYPNPSRGEVILDLPASQVPVLISVNSLVGHPVQHYQVPANTKEFKMDLSSLPNGTYIVAINDGKIESSTKIQLLR